MTFTGMNEWLIRRDLGLVSGQFNGRKAVNFRQHHIQQNQIELHGGKHGQGLHAVTGQHDLIANLLQKVFQKADLS